MLGHCAGLRNSQELGDYVLAHAYVREDHVLDADLPLSVPIPALAEIQVALEQAVRKSPNTQGVETKKIMRTARCATFDKPQLGTLGPDGDHTAAEPVARGGARHGERDNRGQRLPVPRTLWDAAVRVGQAAACAN